MYLTNQRCDELITLTTSPFTRKELDTIKLINDNLKQEHIDSSDLIKTCKSFELYFNYRKNLTPLGYRYIVYSMFYTLETHIFEHNIRELLIPYETVLDFGCGVCEFWLHNSDLLIAKDVTCIDLDEKLLDYPKFLLKDTPNIHLIAENIFDTNLIDYGVILFIEVIMQLPDPVSILKHIWKCNPNCDIIMAHTLYSNSVSRIFSPIRKYILPYIPVLDIAYGQAMSLEKTVDIINEAGGKITFINRVKTNKYIFKIENKQKKEVIL